ncbi:MAG: LysR substrate-binding domain-containing protein [Actinomycetota bacterium]
MRRGLDRPLRVVVAAARAGSLSAAATDLDMTQAAVSQAVKRAEEAIGFPLLERSRRGVTPTRAGAGLLVELGAAYAVVDDAINTAKRATDASTVAISVSTSFATWWLLPRLPEFKRRHPDVALRLMTTDTDTGVAVADLDLWIPLGLIDRPDLVPEPLCDEVLIPVAAPNIAGQRTEWSPRDLLDGPLLHLEERYRPRFDWPTWFERHHLEAPEKLAGDRTTDYSLVLHSALGGQGIALGWSHLVADLIADGRLVALAGPVRTEHPFMVLHRADRPLTDAARDFRTWLIETMAEALEVNEPG